MAKEYEVLAAALSHERCGYNQRLHYWPMPIQLESFQREWDRNLIKALRSVRMSGATNRKRAATG